MSILLKQYVDNNLNKWDEFVKNSNNGTIFHLRKFLSYHIDRKFTDNSLIFKKDDLIIAVFPAVKKIINKKNILFSHPGASYGGFVYNDLSFYDCEKIIYLINEYCLDNNFNEIFFIPSPIIYHNKYNDTLVYLLYRHEFKIIENYLSSVLIIDKNRKSINYLNKRKKRYIKNYKSDSHFSIRINANFEEFYPILKKNKKKFNAVPTHSLNELINLKKIFPDKLHLQILYYNDKPIGGTLNIIVNNNCGLMFYNMIDYNYKDLQAASIQIYESINWAKEHNLDYLDLGVSQLPQSLDPLEPHKTLIHFKEKVSSIGILRIAIHKKY